MAQKIKVHYLAQKMSIVIGLVLMWRGVWYILDAVDMWFLEGNHLWTAIGGIVVGLLVLYLPDKDLNEIERS